jgi:GTP 3',8-cyclase
MSHESLRPLVDPNGRVQRYLRLSVTDTCNLRCVYCRPQTGSVRTSLDRRLSRSEIARLVGLLASMGIAKVRITGGEPLSHPDIVDIVRDIAQIGGIEPPVATTNGTLLKELAHDLRDAGLARLNISLDTLKRDRFGGIAGVGAFDRVIEGIEAAQRAGFDTLKLNAVVMRGTNDDELTEFVEFGAERGIEVRFIEFMPGRSNGWNKGRLVPCAEMRERIGRQHRLAEIIDDDDVGVARRYRVEPLGSVVGFISSVSGPFCAGCGRLRLTADGTLRTCLFRTGELDMAALIDDGADDATLGHHIRRAVALKMDARPEAADLPAALDREMLQIGG